MRRLRKATVTRSLPRDPEDQSPNGDRPLKRTGGMPYGIPPKAQIFPLSS
jgi:hypothetical protein